MTLAVLMLVFGAVLAGVDWYLQPERFVAWAAALAVIAAMAVALRIGGRRHQDAVTLAGLIVAMCLAAPLAVAVGIADRALSERAIMVITGAFFTITGNTLPKTLMPLVPHGDPARNQACRRITGWIWVLDGLAITGVGVFLPIDAAAPASLVLMAIGVFVTLVQMARSRRPRHQGV